MTFAVFLAVYTGDLADLIRLFLIVRTSGCETNYTFLLGLSQPELANISYL